MSLDKHFISQYSNKQSLLHTTSVATLKRKLKQAEAGLSKTCDSYEDLSSSLSERWIEEWKIQEQKALLERGNALDIYTVQISKGEHYSYEHVPATTLIVSKAPSQAEIRLALTEQEHVQGLTSGAISLLALGINLEEAQ